MRLGIVLDLRLEVNWIERGLDWIRLEIGLD